MPPQYLTNVSGTLFFSANDGSAGTELWRSDGTASGTLRVADINSGYNGSAPRELTNVSGTLYFTTTSSGLLLKTDGTSLGVEAIGRITNPRYLTNVSGNLYFATNDGLHGFELWKSAGTAASTVMIKDILPGSGTGISPGVSFTNTNGWLVFKAVDGVNGNEVWVSNGTEQGTKLLADVFSGPSDSLPRFFASTGANVFFTATGLNTGAELWASGPFPPLVTLADGIITIDLSSSTADRNLVARMSGGQFAFVDGTTNAELIGPNSELPTIGVTGYRIVGSTTFSENLTIDHSFGGVVNVPQGIEFDGGPGASDSITIIGATGVDATISPTATDFSIASTNGSAGVSLKVRNSESLTLSAMRRVSVVGNLNVEIPMTISSQLPLDLGAITSMVGGSLTSTGLVSLGAAESIIGAGTVSGRLAGEAGSTILATGSMTLGSATSIAGFFTRGEIDVSTSTVTLLDANQAVLGSLTTLGNATTVGTLNAANGALIDFGNNLIGYGTLSTPNLAAKPTIINGSVDGTSLAKPVTLAGYVKGVGSLNNVSITGTYSPGFSPATVTLGSVSYAASAVTTVELGGTTPGTQYDQLNHVGQALLGGTLDLQLINGFQPVLGDSFTVLTATGGIISTFSNTNLPALPATLGWQVNISSSQVVVSVVAINLAPSDISISSTTLRENLSSGSAVGSFNSVDANAGDTFTYTLVSGSGDTNNAAFSIDGTGTLRSASALNFETQSSYSVRVRSSDQGGLFTEKSFTISLIDLPELAGTPIFGDGTAQRSLVKQITLTFDGTLTIGANAISVNKRGAQGGPVATSISSTTNGLGQTVVQLNFSGVFTRSGALLDGFYELSLNGAGLTRGAESLDANQDGIGGDNVVLGANEADKYFALYGDIDGDGIVGVAEFGQFRTAFGKTSSQVGYDPRFDYESDGVIGVADFGQFRSRFGKPKMSF